MSVQWDPISKKLSGHYDEASVLAVLKSLDTREQQIRNMNNKFAFSEADMNKFIKKLAHSLGLHPRTQGEIPLPIRQWARRAFKTFIYPELYTAFMCKKLSTRFIFEVSDYISSVKHQDIVTMALNQEITNTQFRQLIKERK